MADLLALDQAATLWINHHHHVVLDVILLPVSYFGEMGLGWLAVALALLILGRRRERLTAALFLVALAVIEFLLMPRLRDLWPRPRPYMYLEGIRQLGVRWPGTSFPSSHAHLWALGAVLFGYVYRHWRWPLLVCAILTCYARPYFGMHHVLDVLAGAAVGGLMALPAVWGAKKLGLPEPSPAPLVPTGALEP
jgi:undecaprenyl-diphosphatase